MAKKSGRHPPLTETLNYVAIVAAQFYVPNKPELRYSAPKNASAKAPNMPQPTRRQTSKLQGHSISLSLRIELVDNMNDDSSLARSDEAPLPVDVDATIELKERLQSAEMNCSRLEELYQKYRLQLIAWDAPSPTPSEYDGEVEDNT
ncbi:hypothetical protein DFJ58DRAFT_846190 [Suillus subalutaceus]|uniref:uncharacterized protein n=1 Tax=Suillus subalutaceus TaxID=48586 RepID=UPI001B88473E|nr:uncharacterized protein DFJ58DRAFT_846190 [Suillus subalutaceus]KAG1838155.1 hypothetical protein DFJ58DRAFT_846190 [Suillus subalutaceus]